VLNDGALRIVDEMAANAAHLRIGVSTGPLGERLIDCGATAVGSVEAGLHMARAAMGGASTVEVSAGGTLDRWPLTVYVRSSQPVLACLASQYAGWNLSGDGYFAMASGPGRVLARKEPLFQHIAYTERADAAVLVLEASKPPPEAIVDRVAQATGLSPKRLTFLYAPTQSLAGSVQIVARVLEVALHKAESLGFPLDAIVDGAGTAPVPAPHPDFLAAMGRTNDAIIYGGVVQLIVSGPASAAATLARQLPSRASRDYGEPFAAVFDKFDRDFYKIDPMLFSPAQVIVTALESGETFREGGRDLDLLARSLG
jgi:methenyltetrahydromethanopterin cyclohydrolase